MNEQATPTTPHRTEPAASCCGPAPVQPDAESTPAHPSPCCGTREDAEAAGTCCGPQAKHEAVAAGARCC
ncbi:hypothetical protein SUDANB120_06106 [Streptomyces sp. enrichment culture]|uniref:hypothetical protein n=1 Tax=Streptomyces TaxID=1883 RepID=UPI001676127F|nr:MULTISPECIES: hypothetical protein [Streptomyces]MBD3577516.1 hypothetical protein [Streptomyces sp. KD18]GGT10242.1 hypothetical protein GCM10010286_39840 [Streptomyces toxytricini]